MSDLPLLILWCVVQVTLVGLLAWVLCSVARRIAPASASPVPATAIVAVLLLTACAFVPWPAAWRYGPQLSLFQAATNAETPPTESPANSKANSLSAKQAATLTESPDAATADNVEDATAENPWDESSAVAGASSPPRTSTVRPTPTSPQLPWTPILLTILASGVALGLLQLVGGLIAARAYRHVSRAVHDKELLELTDVLRAELGCTASIELRETPSLATAATIGWRKPLILLPSEWRDWTDDQRRAVLAHEIAHVARHDFLACVLAQASLALHFYHPLVHWLVYRLRLEQELAADALAAAVVGGQQTYLHTLAEMALRQSERPLGWPARTFLPTQGTFMRRIEMLRDAKSTSGGQPRVWPRYLAVATIVVGAMVIAGLRGEVGPVATAQAQDNKPKDNGAAKDEKEQISLARIPNEAVMFAAIRPGQLLKNKETADLVKQLDKSLLHWAESGVDAGKIEQISVAVSVRASRPSHVAVVEATEPIEFDKLAKAMVGMGKDVPEVKAGDRGGLADTAPAFARLGDKAAVIGSAGDIAAYQAGKQGNPAMADGAAWKKIRNRTFVAAIDMRAARLLPGFTPPKGSPEAAVIAPLFEETEAIAIGVAAEKQIQVRVVADCLGEDGATQVKDTAAAGATLLRNVIRGQRSANVQSGREAEPAYLKTLLDAAEKALSNVKVEKEKLLVVAQTSVDLKSSDGGSPLAALLPSVDAARKAARRAQSQNNMKQIMLAIHNYADTFGHLPPAVIYGKDGKGKVPHSWRVELLPYLDQAALYGAYNFDEPWDSDANKKVLEKMPIVYRDPSEDKTNASYYVLVGKGDDEKAFPTIFSKKDGAKFADITDGTSNTIAIVEAKRDIPWTKPEDITYDPKGKLPELGGYSEKGFNVGICDGSVRFLPAEIVEETLRALISPAGGELFGGNLDAPIGTPRPTEKPKAVPPRDK
jgi:beta-lactamase regulating signal transducer with metallopeptidase domain